MCPAVSGCQMDDDYDCVMISDEMNVECQMKMTCVVNTELSEEVDTLYPVTHWSQQSAVNEVTFHLVLMMRENKCEFVCSGSGLTSTLRDNSANK